MHFDGGSSGWCRFEEVFVCRIDEELKVLCMWFEREGVDSSYKLAP
jgi:hypothetical protein